MGKALLKCHHGAKFHLFIFKKMEVLTVKGPNLGLEVCQPVLDGITLPLKDCIHSLGGAPGSVTPYDSPDRCDSQKCLLSALADTPAALLPRAGRPKDGSARAGNLEASSAMCST